MISLVSCRKALLALTSAAKHSLPAPEAMFTRTSVAILCSLAVSSSWSNRFLNLEHLCKVVMAAAGKVGLSSSSSLESMQITIAATPFPLWLGSGFL